MTIWGQCFASLIPAPIGGMRMLADMGITHIRWVIYTNEVCRPDGTFDWSRLDADYKAMTDAGLIPMPNVVWLPRWMTGGRPVNEPYAIWKNQAQEEYTKEERPDLYPPFPSLTSATAPMRAFGRAFGLRYKPAYASVWNEAGGRPYYLQKDEPPSYKDALRPLYRFVIIPFMEGLREVWPGVMFVGPDSESPGDLELFLQLEQEANYALRYDVLAIHTYGELKPPTIADSLNMIGGPGGYLEVIRKFPAHEHTPVAITEYAADIDSPTVEWSAAILKAFPRIGMLFPYLCGQWIESGNDAWDTGRFARNTKSYTMERLIRTGRVGGKRRAV